jgi:hypothetical protein
MTEKQVDVETGKGLGRARAPGSGDGPDSVKSARPCALWSLVR